MKKFNKKVVYLDLYAGKGKYESGEMSTAIRILAISANDSFLKKNLVSILNDVKESHCDNLAEVIKENSFSKKLHYSPKIMNRKVDVLFANDLNSIKKVPTLCFIDPYGYKGLSLTLIKAAIKDWGCDCILFFSTSGINRNILREDCHEDMITVFGRDSLAAIQMNIRQGSHFRARIILDEYIKILKNLGAQYVLPLQINFPRSNRLSHHLIFMSKHFRGFDLIKKVLSRKCPDIDGITQYKFIEGWEKISIPRDLFRKPPMQILGEKLLLRFDSSKLAVKKLVDTCHKEEWLYTDKNIKVSLGSLENEGLISVYAAVGKKRRKGTFGDNTIIEFGH